MVSSAHALTGTLGSTRGHDPPPLPGARAPLSGPDSFLTRPPTSTATFRTQSWDTQVAAVPGQMPCTLHTSLARLLSGLRKGGCECLPTALRGVGVEFPEAREGGPGVPAAVMLPSHSLPPNFPYQLRRIHSTSRAHMTLRRTSGARLGKGGKSDLLYSEPRAVKKKKKNHEFLTVN